MSPLGAKAGQLAPNPVVVMDTSEGAITIELYPDKAPITVKNFLKYVDEKLLRQPDLPPRHPRLHDPGRRVDDQMEEKTGQQPIKNESSNGLQRARDHRHGPHE